MFNPYLNKVIWFTFSFLSESLYYYGYQSHDINIKKVNISSSSTAFNGLIQPLDVDGILTLN